MSEKTGKHVARAIAATILVLVALLFLSYITVHYLSIPVEFARFANAALIAVVIFFIIRLIIGFIQSYFSRYTSASKIHPVTFLLSIFGYFVMGVAVLAVLGVNVSSLILGGSLVTVIIGLATQTVLANQFAGMLITIARPFKIGDHVTINTWQYGGVYPTLFPKYFSVDRIEATAYTGTVTDITINYTVLKLVSGDTIKLPNGVVVQAAVIVRTPGILVKARYEIPKYIPMKLIAENIRKEVESIDDFDGEYEVLVDETTLNTYILMLTARFKGTESDFYRSRIFEGIMKVVEPLKETR